MKQRIEQLLKQIPLLKGFTLECYPTSKTDIGYTSIVGNVNKEKNTCTRLEFGNPCECLSWLEDLL